MKKRLIGGIMTLVVMLVNIAPVLEAGTGNTDYIIINPYKTVDWAAYGQYKANFHIHTVESDGENQPAQMIEDHYSKGYSIIAITDHNFTSTTWDRKDSDAEYITSERLAEINAGYGREGKGMISVPFSTEQSNSDHLNTFWAPFTNGVGATLESNIAKCESLGGISHINHPGRYTGGYVATYSDDMAQIGAAASNEPSTVAKYVKLFEKYPSCVGMEIINKTDGYSYSDRILWDNILKQTMPDRPVWGFCNDDTHSTGSTGYSFNMMLMPENNLDNLRFAMENGTFYSVARVSRRELGEKFVGYGAQPVITNIVVDETQDTITVEAENYDRIEWIADGSIISRGNTIDLNDYEDELGTYVRAQLIGAGGICFTQPFGIKAKGIGTIVAHKEDEAGYVVKQTITREFSTEVFGQGGSVDSPLMSIKFPEGMLSGDLLNKANKVEFSISSIDTDKLPEEVRKIFGGRPLLDIEMAVDGVELDWRNEQTPVQISIPYIPQESELDNTHNIVVFSGNENDEFNVLRSGKYNGNTGRVEFLATQTGLYGVAYNIKTFDDIQTSWAKRQIETLAARGIINGKSLKTFSPDQKITRADFIMMLMGVLDKHDDKPVQEFSDVSERDYYYDAVKNARMLGIVGGIGKNKFNPKGNISRQDMFVLINNALDISGLGLKDSSDLSGFSDSGRIADYARESISKLVAAGIVKGSNNKIRPQDNLTREEAATVLSHLYDLILSKGLQAE